MKFKRAYVRKSEVVSPDSFVIPNKLVDFGLECVGKKEFEPVVLEVKSRKTGNTARIMGTQAIEIEGMSGIYRMSYTSKMIRKNQKVVDLCTDQEYKTIPIGRLVYTGYVIYSLVPVFE